MGRIARTAGAVPAAGLLLLASVACGPDLPPEHIETRSDYAPLVQRFPVIGVPQQVMWVTWNSASRDVPGPTTYWIDAVITLAPQTASALARDFAPTGQGRVPSVQDALRPAVPPGPFLSGAALNEALSTSGWSSVAYLDDERNQLVLSAIDD